LRTVDELMKHKAYEKALRTLQVELCTLQAWIKDQGLRVVTVFEGRDAAGKGGVIKAITERVSPRVFRHDCRASEPDRYRELRPETTAWRCWADQQEEPIYPPSTRT
jgi:polyphosphate kinase